ncbi:BON domain-containing protein [Burkholderia anthina]|uniref:BON domain-containing protein n=1 Tax=Burkholderia anthina TaxID=179879 RepID=UPI00158B71AA|nr:BON domain-containing protein [Burkholderia anthina]
MRTSFKLVAVLLAAAGWAALAHAQADAASVGVAGSAASVPASSRVTASAAPAVLSPAQRKAADRKLKRRVSAALARTRDLNATRILVRVRDGTVTLAGSVPDTGQVNLAVSVARRVDGVASVSNLLRIDAQPL